MGSENRDPLMNLLLELVAYAYMTYTQVLYNM